VGSYRQLLGGESGFVLLARDIEDDSNSNSTRGQKCASEDKEAGVLKVDSRGN